MMTGFQYYIILWPSHEQFDNITRTWLKILVFEQQWKPFITPIDQKTIKKSSFGRVDGIYYESLKWIQVPCHCLMLLNSIMDWIFILDSSPEQHGFYKLSVNISYQSNTQQQSQVQGCGGLLHKESFSSLSLEILIILF